MFERALLGRDTVLVNATLNVLVTSLKLRHEQTSSHFVLYSLVL